MKRLPTLLACLLAVCALMLSAAALFTLDQPAVAFSLAALVQSAAFALLAVGGARLLRGSPSERLGLGPGRLPAWAVALLAVGTLGLSHGLDFVVHLVDLEEVGVLSELRRGFSGTRGWILVLAVAGIAVAPGVAEELLFRGLVQRSLARRLRAWRGGPVLAILLASLLFGALHADPVHSPTAFVLGLYLGAVAQLAGSVRAPIVCHVVNNGTALLGSAFDVPTIGPPAPLLASCLAVAAAALILAARARASGGPPSSRQAMPGVEGLSHGGRAGDSPSRRR